MQGGAEGVHRHKTRWLVHEIWCHGQMFTPCLWALSRLHLQLSKGVGPCRPRHESPRRVKHRLVVHESCIRRRNPRGWRRGRTLQCSRCHVWG